MIILVIVWIASLCAFFAILTNLFMNKYVDVVVVEGRRKYIWKSWLFLGTPGQKNGNDSNNYQCKGKSQNPRMTSNKERSQHNTNNNGSCEKNKRHGKISIFVIRGHFITLIHKIFKIKDIQSLPQEKKS
jgi:hypothetical protein